MAMEMHSGQRRAAPRWLMPTAVIIVAIALLVSGPVAFGIVMSSDDSMDTHNPLLYVLVGLLVAAVANLVIPLISRTVFRGRRNCLSVGFAACALATGGLIVATFAVEMVSVGLGTWDTSVVAGCRCRPACSWVAIRAAVLCA